MKFTLTPTRNGMAYVGSIKGRELVYERSREKVQAESRCSPARAGPRVVDSDKAAKPFRVHRTSLISRRCSAQHRAYRAPFSPQRVCGPELAVVGPQSSASACESIPSLPPSRQKACCPVMRRSAFRCAWSSTMNCTVNSMSILPPAIVLQVEQSERWDSRHDPLAHPTHFARQDQCSRSFRIFFIRSKPSHFSSPAQKRARVLAGVPISRLNVPGIVEPASVNQQALDPEAARESVSNMCPTGYCRSQWCSAARLR